MTLKQALYEATLLEKYKKIIPEEWVRYWEDARLNWELRGTTVIPICYSYLLAYRLGEIYLEVWEEKGDELGIIISYYSNQYEKYCELFEAHLFLDRGFGIQCIYHHMLNAKMLKDGLIFNKNGYTGEIYQQNY